MVLDDGSPDRSAELVRAGDGNEDERLALMRAHRERVREQLSLVLQAAKHRGATPDHVLLSGPPGLGKPVSVHALVLMGDGSRKPMGEVVPGDRVISRLGDPELVSAVYEQGHLECVRLTTAAGRTVVG